MVPAGSVKWVVLGVLLLALAARAAEIPEQYGRFWEKSEGEFPCILSLPLLNIEKAAVMDPAAAARLELPASFSGVRERLKFAGASAGAARENSKTYIGIRLPFYLGMSDDVFLNEDGNAYWRLAARTQCRVVTALNIWECSALRNAEEQACRAMGDSADALAAASYASNDARDAAAARVAELGRMGADYENYSGPARGAYFSAKEALDVDATSLWDSRNVLMGYDGQKPRFAAAYVSSCDVKNSFENGSAGFERPDSYAAAMSLMAGRDENLVTGWAAIYRQVDSAISGMEAECNGSGKAAEEGYGAADANLKALENDGYHLITAELISNFSGAPAGAIGGSFGAAPPDERVAGARALLDAARADIADARRLRRADYEEDCLARAIERNQHALASIAAADAAAAEAESEVQEVAAAAEGLFGRKMGEARNAIDLFSTNSSGGARLKANAERDCSRAAELVEAAGSRNSGERLVALAKGLGMLCSSLLWLSDANRSIEERRDGANDSFERLEGVLARAERDGVDVSFEKEWLSIARQGLAGATAEDLAYFKEEAGRLEDAAYAKAAAQFGYLSSQMAQLDAEIAAIRGYRSILGSAAGLEESFRAFDKLKRDYAGGGAIDPRKALGSYRAIAEKLDGISQEIESSKARMVQEMMEKGARVEVLWEGEPVLDEEMTPSVSVRLANELPFGTNSSLSVSVSGEFPSGLSAVSKDAAIFSVEAGEKKMTAHFTSVSANTAYAISLKGAGEVPARSVGRQQSRVISLSEQELRGSAALEFEALRDLGRLRIPLKLPDGANAVSAEMENGRVAGVADEGVAAERVREGRGSVTVIYSIPNPYSIVQGAAQARRIDNYTARISYNITVFSRALDLENVPVGLFIANASGEGGVSARGLEGAGMRNFGQQQLEGGVAVSWSIARLAKGESASYEVSYEISDPADYAESLYSQVSSLISSLDESGLVPEARLGALRETLSSARSLLDEKKYMRGIAELQDLEAAAEQALRDSEIQEDAKGEYENELASFSDEKNALERLYGQFVSAGLGEEARAIRDSLDEAEGYADDAGSLAREPDYPAASERIASARGMLQIDLSRLLNARVESLSERLTVLGKRQGALSLLGGNAEATSPDPLPGLGAALSSSDYSGFAGQYSEAVREASAEESRLGAEFAGLVPEYENHSRAASGLEDAFESNLELFAKSSTLTLEGRSGAAAVSPLRNSTLERNARNDLGEIGRISSLLSNFSKSPEKARFLEANAAKLAGIGADIARLNQTSASLADASRSYFGLANSSFSEAGMRLEQAKAILPEGTQYSSELQNLTAALGDAEAALAAGRYADAAVLSERVRAGATRLVNAASQVEQKQEGETGSQFQLAYLLLPLLFFLGLGYVFLKRKPEKKQEARAIKKLDF